MFSNVEATNGISNLFNVPAPTAVQPLMNVPSTYCFSSPYANTGYVTTTQNASTPYEISNSSMNSTTIVPPPQQGIILYFKPFYMLYIKKKLKTILESPVNTYNGIYSPVFFVPYSLN